jgi:two-component system nitrate/nitrite response regulator NarL
VTQVLAMPHGSGPSRDISAFTNGNARLDQESVEPTTLPAFQKSKRWDREEGAAQERQTVLIVDRNLLFRAGLTHALSESRFHILAECASIEDLPIHDLTAGHPILLLIGLETARIAATQVALLDFRRRYDKVHIVIFYDHDRSCPLPPEMADVGKLADALLPKDEIDSESVTKAVDLVLLGATVVAKELLSQMAGLNGHDALRTALVTRHLEAAVLPETIHPVQSAQEHDVEVLTVRERLILSHLMKGASNKGIARQVGIAESTVKIHVRNVMLKIDAKNRTQAAMWGFRYLV